MQILFLTAFLFSLPLVSLAFTNGTLLPAYLCGPLNDGFPKSAGTLIPYLKLGNPDNQYNFFPPGPGKVPVQIAGADGVNAANAALAAPAQMIIGAFHNGSPLFNYTKAVKNPTWLVPAEADPTTGQADYTIVPGQAKTFALVAHDTNPGGGGFNPDGIALDGAFIYALDTGTGLRIGAWKNAGPKFVPFPACNLNYSYSLSVGIVHNQLISDCPAVTGLVWMAPPQIVGTVQFIGVGVTDAGFGTMIVEYNTTTNKNAPSLFAQGLLPNQAGAGAPFQPIDAAPDLPWNQTAGVQLVPLATPNPFGALPAALMTVPGVVGIGVVSAIVGMAIGAVVVSAIKPKKSSKDVPLMMINS